MKNKILIIIVCMIVVCFIILNWFSNTKIEKNEIYDENIYNVEEIANIEENFYLAISECRKLYKENNFNNFRICFGENAMNKYMSLGKISIINPYEFKFDKIYDAVGNEIKEFPQNFLDNSKIQYETEVYDIKANKNYLLRIYSYNEGKCYYYILRFDNNGFADIKLICCTMGELENFYSNIEDIH